MMEVLMVAMSQSTAIDSTMPVPRWIVKMARRLMSLPGGRYQIVLTVDDHGHDWTVTDLGKVERA